MSELQRSNTELEDLEQARKDASSTPQLQQWITVPVLQRALSTFFSDTVVLTPGSGAISQGHFASLVPLVEASPRSAPLPAALDAVALVSFATQFGVPELRPVAMERYCLSISRLRMHNVASTSSAAQLNACISLLGMFEVCATLPLMYAADQI
jgi:hypothetical protein